MSDEEDFGLEGVFPVCMLGNAKSSNTTANGYSILQEEERPPTPPPDIKYYTRPNGQQLSVQLVTTHPLWVYAYPSITFFLDTLD